MRQRFNEHDIMNPENIMTKMLQDYIEGALDDQRVFFRASVVAVDHNGAVFESVPPNPKNSIKARVITNGFNANTADEDLPVFWPLFPHQRHPIKEREHALVIFEDERRQHGYWIARLPEPGNVDSSNFVDGTAQYVQYGPNNLQENAAEQAVQGLTAPPTQVSVSDEFIAEDVVPFTPRVGDHVLEGSNNSLIVLGRDRIGNRDTGQRQGAGAVDIVAGRATAEDMDFSNDKARVYVVADTDVDASAGTSSVGQSAQPSSAVIAIGDQIRIVARAGTKIVVTGGDLLLEGSNIAIGNNASHAAVLGDELNRWLGDLLAAIQRLTQATPSGPTVAPPINAAEFTALQGRLSSLISATVKVKQ